MNTITNVTVRNIIKPICTIIFATLISAGFVYPAQAQDPFPNCRLGVGGVTPDAVGYNLEPLNVGVYLDWSAGSNPTAQIGLPAGVQFIQTVRVHQLKECGVQCVGEYVEPYTYTVSPGLNSIANIAAAQPGAIWRIGNEIERPDWNEGGQDEMLPELYATAYHQIREIIKTADPTARIAVGSVILASPLRLAYLDRVWNSYQAQFGHSMGDDIEVWVFHTFLLREVEGSWGAEVPAGFSNFDSDPTNNFDPHDGFLYGVPECSVTIFDEHHNLDEFKANIVNFRTWMAGHGEQNKPLLNTEFGVIYESFCGHSITGPQVRDFMTGSFDYLFNTTDPSIGYPLDENRLVQSWVWYSMNDNNWNGNLFNPNSQNLTTFGTTWQNYVSGASNPLASQPQVNLLTTNLNANPNPAQVIPGNLAAVTLRANIANSGNTTTGTGHNIAVNFWNGDPNDPGSTRIGSPHILEDIPGCGQFATVETTWTVGVGDYTWYVTVDTLAGETNATDNTAHSVLSVEDDGTPVSDLAVSKTVSDNTPYTGDTITYTVVITNQGPDIATGVEVDDLLPGGITFSQYAASHGIYTSSTGLWAAGTLTPDEQAALTITAVVNTGQGGNLMTNTATISAAGVDLVPGNNKAAASIAPTVIADLAVSKSVDNDAPLTGSSITYTLNITNNGPDVATGVIVDDLLPAGVTFGGYSASQGTYSDTGGHWNVGNLAANGPAALTLSVRVNGDQGGQALTNSATISATELDLFSGNNTAGATIIPEANTDLALTKLVNNPAPFTGDTITYTLTVTNYGPDTARNVVITDSLPAGVTFGNSIASQGGYLEGSGLWAVGNLSANATATLHIVAGVDVGQAAQLIINAATAGNDIPDLNPANDAAGAEIVPVTNADLVLSKIVNDHTPYVGDTITYTIIVTNSGPEAATTVVLTDPMPAGLTLGAYTVSQGVYTGSDGLWAIGSLPPRATASLTVSARVNSGQVGNNLINRAEVSAAEADPGPENNLAEVDVEPIGSADLSLAKSVSDASPYTGAAITYTLVVTNSGPDIATRVLVDDSLPEGIIYKSSRASRGAYNAGANLWNIDDLPVDEIATLTLTVQVEANQAGNIITNTAGVSASGDDPVLFNNTAGVLIVPRTNADLSLSKSAGNNNPYTADTVTYTLVVTNNGPDLATSVVVNEQLPDGLVFAGYTASQGVYTNSTGQWAIGNLTADAVARLTISATVEKTEGGNNLVNTAEVSGNEPDLIPANNSATETIIPVNNADLALFKSVSDDAPYTGSTVTYTLVVTNSGPNLAHNVAVNELLPNGLTFGGYSASQGIYTHTSGVWAIGDLPVNTTAALVLSAAINTGQGGKAINNTATVFALEADLQPGNNSRPAATHPVGNADLVLSKIVDTDTPYTGSAITYTLSVLNLGPDTATDVWVSEMLPAGLTFGDYAASHGSFAAATGRWDVGNLALNSTASLTLSVQVNTGRGGNTMTNTVTVSSTESDLALDDNTAGVTITPVANADLSLFASSDAGVDTINYIVGVQNIGPDDATGVAVSNFLLPEGLNLSSSHATRGVYSDANGLWQIGSLNSTIQVTLTVTATRNAGNSFTISSIRVSGNEFDPDESNNEQSATPSLSYPFYLPVILKNTP